MRNQMGNSRVDRDQKYMYKMWGTTRLITDYWKGPAGSDDPQEYILSEVMHHKAKPTKSLTEGEIYNPEDYKDIPERY